MPARKPGLYPTAAATITALLTKPVKAAAASMAEDLAHKVSAGPRSGVQHRGLPRQSSSDKEYPQEQSSDLVKAVDAQPGDKPLQQRVGFFGDDQAKLDTLEYGRDDGTMAPRAPLQRLMDDADVRQKALAEARKAVT